jgi:hypothetical protein
MNDEKCLRHQIQPTDKNCRLCASKRIGRGRMMNETVCFSCGLPSRFRAFLTKRGDVWKLAEYCRKCP